MTSHPLTENCSGIITKHIHYPALAPGCSRRRFVAFGDAGVPLLAQTPNRDGILRYGCGHCASTDTLDPGLFDNDF